MTTFQDFGSVLDVLRFVALETDALCPSTERLLIFRHKPSEDNLQDIRYHVEARNCPYCRANLDVCAADGVQALFSEDRDQAFNRAETFLNIHRWQDEHYYVTPLVKDLPSKRPLTNVSKITNGKQSESNNPLRDEFLAALEREYKLIKSILSSRFPRFADKINDVLAIIAVETMTRIVGGEIVLKTSWPAYFVWLGTQRLRTLSTRMEVEKIVKAQNASTPENPADSNDPKKQQKLLDALRSWVMNEQFPTPVENILKQEKRERQVTATYDALQMYCRQEEDSMAIRKNSSGKHKELFERWMNGQTPEEIVKGIGIRLGTFYAYRQACVRDINKCINRIAPGTSLFKTDT